VLSCLPENALRHGSGPTRRVAGSPGYVRVAAFDLTGPAGSCNREATNYEL
jgi:hypothetical protein